MGGYAQLSKGKEIGKGSPGLSSRVKCLTLKEKGVIMFLKKQIVGFGFGIYIHQKT